MSKEKLRPEVIQAIQSKSTLRLKLALANSKTEMTIRNWCMSNDPMLTTAMNVDIICSELGVEAENIFALAI